MNAIGKIILFIPIALALASCAQNRSSQPDWVNEPHADYPADRFLVGVATGQTCDEAVDRAIARIAQQIEVRVNASEQRRSLVNSVESLGDPESFTFQTEVHLVTDTTLLGVEVVETLARSSGSCTARVALDITRSINLYDEAIEQRQVSVRSSLERADEADSQWLEFIATAEALRVAIDRDVLAIARGVLASRLGQQQPSLTMIVPMLIDRYESLREQISISVVPIGDCPAQFIDAARNKLSQQDLPLEPDYFGLLQIRIGWEAKTEQTYDPRWWSSRWRLSVTLYDAERGVTIANQIPQTGSAYGLTEDDAQQQALSDAAGSLVDAIAKLIDQPGGLKDEFPMHQKIAIHAVLLAGILGALLAGCEKSQRVERVDPSEVLDYEVKFDEDDAREVANAMIEDVLSRPWIDIWLGESGGKRPTIIVGDILNNTSDYIDSGLFTVAFERDLLNSGRVAIVASSSERSQVRDEREQGQDWSRPETVKRMAYELGADLMLIGRIGENREKHRNKKRSIRYYQVALELIDIESNQKVWIGLHEIEKRKTKIN
jgi:uncharacterized protein (TIGR02722 family)